MSMYVVLLSWLCNSPILSLNSWCTGGTECHKYPKKQVCGPHPQQNISTRWHCTIASPAPVLCCSGVSQTVRWQRCEWDVENNGDSEEEVFREGGGGMTIGKPSESRAGLAELSSIRSRASGPSGTIWKLLSLWKVKGGCRIQLPHCGANWEKRMKEPFSWGAIGSSLQYSEDSGSHFGYSEEVLVILAALDWAAHQLKLPEGWKGRV